MKTAAVKTHLSLNVRDVEESAHWYEVFFGVPTHKRRPGYANFDLEAPALKLALEQTKKSTVPGEAGTSLQALKLTLDQRAAGSTGALNHLGILVDSTDAVLEIKSRLEASGLITFSEENVTCCYAKQDKIWVRDPDGNAWEVYALLDDMLDEDHEEEVAESPCCQGEACECCA